MYMTRAAHGFPVVRALSFVTLRVRQCMAHSHSHSHPHPHSRSHSHSRKAHWLAGFAPSEPTRNQRSKCKSPSTWGSSRAASFVKVSAIVVGSSEETSAEGFDVDEYDDEEDEDEDEENYGEPHKSFVSFEDEDDEDDFGTVPPELV
eukprot:1196141-Prorocentrum_minimum.AAC.8